MPSLADEIAQLLNPAPKAGEDEEDGFLTHEERPSLISEQDRAAAAHAPPGRAIRGDAIQMSEKEAARYAGRRVSRQELERREWLRGRAEEGGTSDDDDDGEEEEDEEEDSEHDGDEEEEEEGSDVEGRGLRGMRHRHVRAVRMDKGEVEYNSGADGADGGEESSEDEGNGESDERSDDGEEGDVTLYSEWANLAEGENALLKHLQASRSDESRAAAQAKGQHTLYMQLMRARIKMQGALTSSIRWPASTQSLLWDATPALRSASSAAATSVRELLSDLLKLRSAIARAHAGEPYDEASLRTDGTGGPAPPPLSELSPDKWWDVVSAGDGALNAQTIALVEEAEAAAGADGSSLRSMTRFKAAGAGGILKQVEHFLSQMPPGSTLRQQRAHTLNARPLGLDAMGGGVEDMVGEVYDDGPFYQSLLRAVLEDGNSGIAPGAAPKLKRTKRKTDSRQSKGRRLSYEVQPKLQNFMFPIIPEHPVILSELFSSVFGKKPAGVCPSSTNGGAIGRSEGGGAKRQRVVGAAGAHAESATIVADDDEDIEVGGLFMR